MIDNDLLLRSSLFSNVLELFSCDDRDIMRRQKQASLILCI